MNIIVNTLKDGYKTASVDNIVITVDARGFSAIIGSREEDNDLNYSPVFGYSTEYQISGDEYDRIFLIFKEIRDEKYIKSLKVVVNE